MQINQIIYFMALCEERNFARAAERCRIAQPSLTNAIRSLEEELGHPLFKRKPKLELTNFGLTMKPHLKRVLRAFNRALAVADEHRSDRPAGKESWGQYGPLGRVLSV